MVDPPPGWLARARDGWRPHARQVPDAAVRFLRSRGGAARWLEIVGRVPRRALEVAVGRGAITRVTAGVYALPDAPPALVLATVHNGLLTCASAVAQHGLAVLHVPQVPHVAVPRSRGRTPSAARESFPALLHRCDGASRAGRDGPAVVPVAEAVARMLVCFPATEALVALDSALHQGRTSASAVRRALPVRAPVRARALLRLADARAASPTETLARLALGAAGLRVEVGVPIEGVGWVDLLVEGRVVVELDGYAYHSGTREFGEDRRRDRVLASLGLVVLRFTYYDVVADPGAVVWAVRAALAAPRMSAHSR